MTLDNIGMSRKLYFLRRTLFVGKGFNGVMLNFIFHKYPSNKNTKLHESLSYPNNFLNYGRISGRQYGQYCLVTESIWSFTCFSISCWLPQNSLYLGMFTSFSTITPSLRLPSPNTHASTQADLISSFVCPGLVQPRFSRSIKLCCHSFCFWFSFLFIFHRQTSTFP